VIYSTALKAQNRVKHREVIGRHSGHRSGDTDLASPQQQGRYSPECAFEPHSFRAATIRTIVTVRYREIQPRTRKVRFWPRCVVHRVADWRLATLSNSRASACRYQSYNSGTDVVPTAEETWVQIVRRSLDIARRRNRSRTTAQTSRADMLREPVSVPMRKQVPSSGRD